MAVPFLLIMRSHVLALVCSALSCQGFKSDRRCKSLHENTRDALQDSRQALPMLLLTFHPAAAWQHMGQTLSSLPMHNRPAHTRLRSAVLSNDPHSTTNTLYDFTGGSGTAAVDAWERIDDVIMGGVSSSRLALSSDGSGALFEGRLRAEGGGFCGQRMKLLAEPLDLSANSGVFLECEASSIGAEPDKRVWKMAIRTKQDRGEVIYQTQFTPPTERGVVKLPFESFRLVRGPRIVPGVPPLSSSQVNETYQMSIIVTKFKVSEEGGALSDFEEGPFSLKLFSVGTFAEAGSTSEAATSSVVVPRPLTEQEQSAAQPKLQRVLRPLFKVLFSEKARRRRAASKLLEKRGSTRMQRIRLGWAWRKAAAGGTLGAFKLTAALVARDVAGLIASIPLRVLFTSIFFLSRAIRKIKGNPSANRQSA